MIRLKSFCIKVSSKKSLCLLFLLIIVLFVLWEINDALASDKSRLFTNEDRVLFINSLGYEIDNNFTESKEIIIPYNFNDIYENYNALQKQVGYNLENYKGCPAVLHKYKLAGSDKYINLIVYNGNVIGGDISSSQLNGEMLPLDVNNENSQTG